MSDPTHEREIRLHFEGSGTRDHTLPAQALVRSLEQTQRIIYLLAKFTEGYEHGQRARISYDIEKRFALVCKVPEEGGYTLPAEIGDPTHQLFDAEQISAVSRIFREVTTAVSDGNEHALRRVVPDTAYRSSLIKAYKAIQPPKRSGLLLSIEDGARKRLMDGSKAARAIAALDARPADVGYTPAYVAGSLVRMDFDERRLHLKLLSGQSLTASYTEDYEPVLLEHPRDLIQVHGNVRYGENDTPVSLTEVDEIIEVDESPIEVKEIVVRNKRYAANPPCVFRIQFNREDKVYDLSGDFGVFLSEETRGALEDALDATLDMLWTEFAEEDQARLTPKAQELRKSLLERFREAHDAA